MAMNETELQSLMGTDATNPITSRSEETVTHPLQTSETPEMDEDLAIHEEPKLEIQSLNKIVSTKESLEKAKESIDGIIKALADNPSYITRASNLWGGLTLWQKIGAGVALSGPTLAVGLFAHIGVLVAIGGSTALAYATSAAVLEDHHTCNVNIEERLRSGMTGVQDLLGVIINALDKICQDLKQEVKKFAEENLKLTANVTNLREQVDTLTGQVDLLIKTQILLSETRENLEKTAQSLEKSVNKQTELLQKNQELLTEVRQAYEANQKELSIKVAELQVVREEMGLEVEKVRIVASTLQGAVCSLSNTVVSSAEQRSEYKRRMEEFLANTAVSFDKVADRICDAEVELVVVKDELKVSHQLLQELLARQEDQVVRLEAIDREIVEENIKPSTVNIKSLRRNGIYRAKRDPLNIIYPSETQTLQIPISV